MPSEEAAKAPAADVPEASAQEAELPTSEFVARSRRSICACMASLLAGVAVVAARPSGRAVWDGPGIGACAYVFMLFCSQVMCLEWPEVPPHMLGILSLGSACFLGPECLSAFGLWGWQARVAAVFLDVGAVAAAYCAMVRGTPVNIPPGSLRGKNFVITGCNTGIGYETARAVAAAGATAIFACRTEARARAAMERLLQEEKGRVSEDQLLFIPLDVSSMTSVRRFAEIMEEKGIDTHVLILNAGVLLSSRKLSEDGLEMTMASNHFGHFALTQLLLPRMLAAEARGEAPRIVVVGSNMCYLHSRFDFTEVTAATSEEERAAFLAKPYTMFRMYGQSKMANFLFAAELAKRLKATGSFMLTSVVHPGDVLTEVMRDMHPLIVKLNQSMRCVLYAFLKSCPQGAACTLHAATAPSLAEAGSQDGCGDRLLSGCPYLVRSAPAPVTRAMQDGAAAARLWDLSEKLTGVKCPI